MKEKLGYWRWGTRAVPCPIDFVTTRDEDDSELHTIRHKRTHVHVNERFN